MSIKAVTVDDIMSFNPCSEYTREKVEVLRKSVCGRRKKITALDVLKLADIPYKDKCWLVLRPELMEDTDLHAIGLYAAEKIALPIWLKYYPDDNRPAEAIRIKKLWLKGKATDVELAAAIDAARDAAWAAAEDAARDAAWAAARAAARDAAWAAAIDAARAAAWDAARAAAWDAAIDAARDAAWEKIIKKIKLLLEARDVS
jgi:hypothetical protein